LMQPDNRPASIYFEVKIFEFENNGLPTRATNLIGLYGNV
jgi:hypothetical protein